MKQDIILAGVGGQGILSIAFVIDQAALKQGLNFKQAEVHGMAQRGGAVLSHLRLSEDKIYSDLVPRGTADLLLSVEPLEVLRYGDYLAGSGIIITSRTPFINIPDYPDLDDIEKAIHRIGRAVIVDSGELAKQAGSTRTQNIVMLGAASNRLMVKEHFLRECIEELFAAKGEAVVKMNLEAFDLGKKASEAVAVT